MNDQTQNTAKPAEQVSAESSLAQVVLAAENVNNNEQAQPGQPAAETEKPALDSQGLAVALVVGVSQLATVVYPCLSYDIQTKEKAVEVLVPVLDKYNLNSPLLDRWKEEIAAGMFFGGLIFQSYMQVQAWKAEQAKKETDGKTAGTNE